MFSGIIEKSGTLVKKVQEKNALSLTIRTSVWDKPLKRGESICMNGVCLTVVRIPNKNEFVVQVVPETIAQTTVGDLKIRDKINLERSLMWGERIGGHFVLGHVDGVGRVVTRTRGKSYVLTIEVPPPVIQHFVPKGSVAVDGISLTIQKLFPNSITIAIIPHTAKVTTLGKRKKGDRVNLEADVIAKHLARWVQNTKNS
ncbi:MAG: riboflavin synthase subunit alpha [Omnitrophica bacterium RIFCSPLOWO2_12_FULL_44_17]|uniref:Riboflavin synthase n=1 Tax=Candidatus Danuiimicrobium aquiferis TaxID=1801832 RepID=A0A1G1KXA3_9BACT|nr:MAG: riboflavin synthase subunit alpha [Omnitrophica bacterium RIFCSPHIGHO2_02_FULL_45_28]OGW90282.1 MAG: riboflavin synthase subunit alpha [Omnitrophica bacterium RIFCSPHIGHO2_12_FULL_44_12]OGW97229.1 MAG: riboflavin synthase subunit alpha [Omnitrophica bacterium RIFCSPLOWO2_12_FULL_44_17]OGX02285.1 MAG: riboflavin synthase subunit alpha [Omnitrophica bacterium RIFCSPLOWO2_02_FULL_44_11]